jgi:hypothetical protein
MIEIRFMPGIEAYHAARNGWSAVTSIAGREWTAGSRKLRHEPAKLWGIRP